MRRAGTYRAGVSIGPGSRPRAAKAATAARLANAFDVFAARLDGRSWLLGETFSAADLYLFMMVRWGRALPAPPRCIATLARHAAQVTARPAVQAALAAEGIAAPYI